MIDDFVWCPVSWDAQEHVCSVTKPGHTTHICCCGAVKPEEIHEKGPGQVVVSP